MRFKIQYRIVDWDSTAAMEQMSQTYINGLNKKVLPHLLQVAKARAPVGIEGSNRGGNRFNKSSFERLQLAPFGSLGNEDKPVGPEKTLQRFHKIDEEHRVGRQKLAKIIRTHYGTKTRDPNVTAFFRGTSKANKGVAPTEIRLTSGGGIRGAFRHRSGTLRDSHIIVPARRVGHKIIGQVAATAPYAVYVHEGFTHQGGKDHSGQATHIKGRKWLRTALANVKNDFINPSTYQG